MNTNASDFENELRDLRPAAAADVLEDRIARELAPSLRLRSAGVLARPGRRGVFGRIFGPLCWATAGAAAAVALIAGLHRPQKPAPSQIAIETEIFQPAESDRELVDAADEGVRYVEGEEPVRQMRYNYLERYAWTDHATGARVEVEVPREDILWMPVAMQ